jgi:hypothetical protein
MPYFTQFERALHELAMARELGNHVPMNAQAEALKLIGSFARFVQKEAPDEAPKLGQLAVEWAKAKRIPQDQLLEAIMQADEWDG